MKRLKTELEWLKDYGFIGLVLAYIKDRKTAAIEALSKGHEVLRKLEEETGYHDPFSDMMQGYISELEEDTQRWNEKKLF